MLWFGNMQWICTSVSTVVFFAETRLYGGRENTTLLYGGPPPQQYTTPRKQVHIPTLPNHTNSSTVDFMWVRKQNQQTVFEPSGLVLPATPKDALYESEELQRGEPSGSRGMDPKVQVEDGSWPFLFFPFQIFECSLMA